jgi:hypothetical protein
VTPPRNSQSYLVKRICKLAYAAGWFDFEPCARILSAITYSINGVPAPREW